MPTITVEIDHEVEVYCNTCGNGLCSNTDYTQGRTRGIDQFRVEVCDKCILEKDKEIEFFKQEIEELKNEIEDLKDALNQI